MRITSINTNQKYQPKFQALKIDQKLSKKLYTETPNFIKRLTEIGTEIAEIKRYHVVLKDSVKPMVLADDPEKYGHMDYFQELKQNIEPYLGKPYYATAGDETVAGIRPNVPEVFRKLYKEEVQLEKYTEFTKLDELGQAAEYSKLLDKVTAINEQRQAAAELAQRQKQLEESEKRIEHNKNVAALLREYGVNSEVKSQETEKTKNRWWNPFKF